MRVYKEFSFEAAHCLPNVPKGHKCENLHGHSYVVVVTVCGPVGKHTGWLIDYADIARAWAPLHAQLDHRYINDLPGLENSTSENLAVWIWDRLKPQLPELCEVVVRETATAGSICNGE